MCVKRGVDDKFSVTMGSFTGAELSELCGLYLLSLITQLVPRDQVGLYRDDGILVTPARPRQADILRKKLEELFRKEDLSIEARANFNSVNFLDVHFKNSKFL